MGGRMGEGGGEGLKDAEMDGKERDKKSEEADRQEKRQSLQRKIVFIKFGKSSFYCRSFIVSRLYLSQPELELLPCFCVSPPAAVYIHVCSKS